MAVPFGCSGFWRPLSAARLGHVLEPSRVLAKSPGRAVATITYTTLRCVDTLSLGPLGKREGETVTAQLTFLFTDIEASTRGWEHHPEDMSAALARHDEVIQQAVNDEGGKVFKHTGDGICAVFSTAPAALGAALAAQASLQCDEWPNEPLRVRMASTAVRPSAAVGTTSDRP
jgi:class 3 adenylate cyclase